MIIFFITLTDTANSRNEIILYFKRDLERDVRIREKKKILNALNLRELFMEYMEN